MALGRGTPEDFRLVCYGAGGAELLARSRGWVMQVGLIHHHHQERKKGAQSRRIGIGKHPRPPNDTTHINSLRYGTLFGMGTRARALIGGQPPAPQGAPALDAFIPPD